MSPGSPLPYTSLSHAFTKREQPLPRLSSLRLFWLIQLFGNALPSKKRSASASQAPVRWDIVLFFVFSSYPCPYRNSHSKYFLSSFAPQRETSVTFVYDSFLSSLKIKQFIHSPYPLTHWSRVNIARDLQLHLFFSSILHQYLRGESYF